MPKVKRYNRQAVAYYLFLSQKDKVLSELTREEARHIAHGSGSFLKRYGYQVSAEYVRDPDFAGWAVEYVDTETGEVRYARSAHATFRLHNAIMEECIEHSLRTTLYSR